MNGQQALAQCLVAVCALSGVFSEVQFSRQQAPHMSIVHRGMSLFLVGMQNSSLLESTKLLRAINQLLDGPLVAWQAEKLTTG